MISILCYLNSMDGLPDPRGSLSGTLRPREIAEANRQVRAIQQEKKCGQKKGQYNCYSEAEHAAMGKYACQHGATAAAKYFSKKLGKAVSKSTVQAIKKTYTQEQRKQPCGSDSAELEHLSPKKRGRKVMLESNLDSVQAHVCTVREGGGVVNSRIVIAGARGILFSSNRSLHAEHEGPIVLSQSWAQLLLKWMDFMCRKGTTAKS